MLAAPHLYRTIRRTVEPAHVTRLMDVWVAYAEHGDRYFSTLVPVPEPQRRLFARELRALVAAWTPPDLPAEITEAARALLRAEGVEPPQGDWDSFAFDLEEDEPVEDALIWPEGIPLLLRRTQSEPAPAALRRALDRKP